MMKKHHFNFDNSHFIKLSIAVIFTLLSAILLSCTLSSLALKNPANRYALVIGVQDYQNINDLSYPDNDAHDMSTLLASHGWNVKSQLVSSAATFAAIESALTNLSTDKDATILVYYSGHGTSLNGLAYILPYDTTATYINGELSSLTNVISATSLIAVMEAVPAKNRVLILDSCYSGGFTKEANAVDTSPDDYCRKYGTIAEKELVAAALSKFNSLVAANLASQDSRDLISLSAAGPGEVSWDDIGAISGGSDNGVFTNYLLKAAEFGDADGDGYVSVSEAFSYAKRKIKANWNAEYWDQRDRYGDYSYDFLPHISGGTGDIALYAPVN